MSPAYNSQAATNSPLYSLSHGIPGGVALWNGDTQAQVTANPFSLAAHIPHAPYTGGQKKISVELSFSGAPGAFSVQVQTADTDQTAVPGQAYNSEGFGGASPGVINAVNANNYARVELLVDAEFVRLYMATPPANNVSVTARVFLQ